jgi:hypothetical protein
VDWRPVPVPRDSKSAVPRKIFDVASVDLLMQNSGIVWGPGRFAGLLHGGVVRRLGSPAAHPPSASRPGVPGAAQLTVKSPWAEAPSDTMSCPMPLIPWHDGRAQSGQLGGDRPIIAPSASPGSHRQASVPISCREAEAGHLTTRLRRREGGGTSLHAGLERLGKETGEPTGSLGPTP